MTEEMHDIELLVNIISIICDCRSYLGHAINIDV